MVRYFAIGAVALLGLWLSASAYPAQEPKPADEKQLTKSTPTKSTPAATVKFRKDLNLPFASLNTLGTRIDTARRAGDPVALANSASELAVAEKVSGKTASLTSKQLIAEAAELAKLRRQEVELKAVLHVSEQVALEEQKVAELKNLTKLAGDEKRLIAKGEEPDAPRKVVVNNYSTQYIDIQINGYLRGQVLPGATRTFTIEQRWNPVVLKGWGDADETTFGPVILQGRFEKHTWNINGDDAVPNIP
jgi:hypothetical protein